MLDRNQRNMNIKDSNSFSSSNSNLSASFKDNKTFSTSYTKTNKLIAALYMVTDIIDTNEPLRAKLWTLGTEIISDIHSPQASSKVAMSLSAKIVEVVSFLDIANLIGMISEMNHSILQKEFVELMNSVKESQSTDFYAGYSTLADFLEESRTTDSRFTVTAPIKDNIAYKGHHTTRIGVQKGHDLLKALSDRIPSMSFNKDIRTNGNSTKEKIDTLKTERRAEILSIIKDSGGTLTITDIKTRARGPLLSQSEKTLQRELFAMVQDGVLNKAGEKRWSRYSLKN